MLEKLKKFFGLKPTTPTVGLQTHAVMLNPSNAQHVARQRGRIGRLEQAIAGAKAGTYRDALEAELARRKAAMVAAGLEV